MKSPQTRTEELVALSELRALIRQEGLDRPTPVPALAVLLFHVATMLGGIAVFLLFEVLWIRVLALLVSTYGALGIGMTGHNASHYAVTGLKTIDRGLTYLTMTVCNGIAATFWRHKHVRLHHVAPNNIGVDSDIDLMPFFALSQEEVAQATGWRRKFFRIQHWIFPLAVSLNMLNLKLQGVSYLIGELRGQRRWRATVWVDIACLSLHVTAFLIVPALFFPIWQVIGFYVLREVLHGYVLFAVAAPAHFPAEARFVKADSEGSGLLARQIYTTVNFRTGFWGRLVCLGAEYQIEHHLLPEANPLKLARTSKIVEAFCHRYGYPYRSFGWGEAIVKSLLALRNPKPTYRIDDLIAHRP